MVSTGILVSLANFRKLYKPKTSLRLYKLFDLTLVMILKIRRFYIMLMLHTAARAVAMSYRDGK
jgi:hypothetical protein